MSRAHDGVVSHVPVGPNATFFEDLTPGTRLSTQGRTITPTDGAVWAMFTGDMNPMHVDEEFAAEHGLFGGVFPPGLMVVAIASGLKERLGIFAGTGLAMLRQTVEYRRPVLPGETVHVELTVEATRRHPGRARGEVVFAYAVVTGDGEVAVEGRWEMLVRARSDA